MAELLDVLGRLRLKRYLKPDLKAEVLAQLYAVGTFFIPVNSVIECRDPDDNKYLEPRGGSSGSYYYQQRQ